MTDVASACLNTKSVYTRLQDILITLSRRCAMYTNRVFGLLALLFIVLHFADIQTTANMVQQTGMSFEYVEYDVREIESNPLMRYMIKTYGFFNAGLIKVLFALTVLLYLCCRASLKTRCIILYCASGFY